MVEIEPGLATCNANTLLLCNCSGLKDFPFLFKSPVPPLLESCDLLVLLLLLLLFLTFFGFPIQKYLWETTPISLRLTMSQSKLK